MLNANNSRMLLANMKRSKDSATRELAGAIYNMCDFDPNTDQFNSYTQERVDRAIVILTNLKLRLQGYTHPGINGLEW